MHPWGSGEQVEVTEPWPVLSEGWSGWHWAVSRGVCGFGSAVCLPRSLSWAILDPGHTSSKGSRAHPGADAWAAKPRVFSWWPHVMHPPPTAWPPGGCLGQFLVWVSLWVGALGNHPLLGSCWQPPFRAELLGAVQAGWMEEPAGSLGPAPIREGSFRRGCWPWVRHERLQGLRPALRLL